MPNFVNNYVQAQHKQLAEFRLYTVQWKTSVKHFAIKHSIKTKLTIEYRVDMETCLN